MNIKFTYLNKYLLGLTILLGLTAYAVYKNKYLLENFNISPYNSYEVNPNTLNIHQTIDASKEFYSSLVQNSFKNINLKEINKSTQIYAKDFILRDILQTSVKKELNEKFADNKIEVSDIEKIGWYNDNENKSVIFNFDINIINRRVMWVLPVKIWVKLDTQNLCSNTEGCIDTVSELIRGNLISKDEIIQNMQLVGIILDNLQKFNVKAVDLSSPNYFQIKNTLHLTEPFLTSREEMRLKNVDNK